MASGPNLLTGDNSNFEGGTTGGWNPSGATIANSTALAHSGTHSLLITSTSTGLYVFTAPIPVTLGSSYIFSGWLSPVTTVRSVSAGINLYDSGGGFLGAVNGTTVNEAGVGLWTQITVTGVVPVTAAQARGLAYVNPTVNADQHYFDDASFALTGATPTFIQWKTHSGTGPGLYPSTVRGRVAQAVASIVSGQNPDGTIKGT